MKSKTNSLSSRKGMTLTEVLVAMTLLVLIIFVFTPAFLSYFKNVRTAGEMTKKTYERASLMERLVANKGGGNDAGYETVVNGVPLKLSAGGKTVDFSTQIIGHLISENLNLADSYATFYTTSASNTMVCFPASLNDDFLTKDITVVPKGFKFDEYSFDKEDTSDYHFEVYNTNSSGTKTPVDPKYYDISPKQDGNEGTVAVFTFKGANNVISFENSPLYIQYCANGGMLYEVKVEISAPEIIMVGEKASDDNYYYYVTKGVDTETGNMEILAKKMTGDAALKSAMNDVEWVAKGRGDDGNGNVNQYGYYVMGGDAGQVRRFWRNEKTGNYYWGGDNLVNYDRYAFLHDDGTPNNDEYNTQGKPKPYENLDETLTTQASFKSIFRSGQSHAIEVDGIQVNELFNASKWSIIGKNDYKAFSSNYFTANITPDDNGKVYITLGKVAKIRAYVAFQGYKDFRYYGCDVDASEDEYKNKKLYSWLAPGQTKATNFYLSGYKDATEYEYPWDDSLITITSVGAIQINSSTSNNKYYESQGSTAFNSDVYPTKSYTLYCGYIPSVLDLWGFKTKAAIGGYTAWGHIGTIGAAYSNKNNSWYPVGKFGDIHTVSKALSSDVFGTNENDLKYQTLLNYNSESHDYNDDEKYPLYRPGKRERESGSRWYTAGETEAATGVNAAGLALPGEGTWGSITSGKEVDVTMGYLSHPFAIALNNPESIVIEGGTGSDYYFRNATEGVYDHEFLSSGLRDNVTMLDVKSFHDDLTGNNISLAVGYTLSYLFSDHYYSSRLGQVYNTGIVYLRATGTGDGSSNYNDAEGDLSAGKGWSLKKETNVFHQFFGTEQYLGNDKTFGDGSNAIHGWDTDDHRAFFNIISDQDNFPGNGDAHGVNPNEGESDYGTNCHPMAQTECTTCNWGTTGDGKPQAMWGTANGTLMSWFYDQENVENSKITSVTKEFENYKWFKKIGTVKDDRFYDQPSVKAGRSGEFGFISTLDRINDVCCADDVWVVAGNQAQENTVAPKSVCASGGTLNGVEWKPYSGNGEHASYVNVKYCADRTNNLYLWKAVKIADSDDVNIIQLSYSQGIWYAMGYIDTDEDGKNDANENAVLFWSKSPTEKWNFCKTRTSADSPNYVQNMNEAKPTVALTFDESSAEGKFKAIGVSGINSAASQG